MLFAKQCEICHFNYGIRVWSRESQFQITCPNTLAKGSHISITTVALGLRDLGEPLVPLALLHVINHQGQAGTCFWILYFTQF